MENPKALLSNQTMPLERVFSAKSFHLSGPKQLQSLRCLPKCRRGIHRHAQNRAFCSVSDPGFPSITRRGPSIRRLPPTMVGHGLRTMFIQTENTPNTDVSLSSHQKSYILIVLGSQVSTKSAGSPSGYCDSVPGILDSTFYSRASTPFSVGLEAFER